MNFRIYISDLRSSAELFSRKDISNLRYFTELNLCSGEEPLRFRTSVRNLKTISEIPPEIKHFIGKLNLLRNEEIDSWENT